jgi:hypothetical protein
LLEERADGEIVNVATGKPFSPSDACVSRGATLGYDAAATDEATRAVRAFVAATFRLGA